MTPTTPIPPLDLLQRYTVPEAAQYWRKSRAKIYVDIAAGKIKIIKDGRRTYIPGSEIARLSAVGQG